jgi:anti-sigma factor RsiW
MVSRLRRLFGRIKMHDDCMELRENCSDYVDGELDVALQDRIRAHIVRCPPCNSFIQTLLTTIEMLKGTPKQNAPDSFRRRILDKIEQERHHS